MDATSDLQARFETAQAQSRQLDTRPDNPTLLKLYSLYKQATEGDNAEPKPSFSDVVARAKWDAWTARKGTPPTTARQQYIALVDALRAA